MLSEATEPDDGDDGPFDEITAPLKNLSTAMGRVIENLHGAAREDVWKFAQQRWEQVETSLEACNGDTLRTDLASLYPASGVDVFIDCLTDSFRKYLLRANAS